MTKYLTLIAVAVGIAIGAAGSLTIAKAVKPEIKVVTEKVIAPQCPPCNGIDFDKIKSKALTIQNKQYLTVNGDSTLESKIRSIIREEMAAANLVKCKR